MWLTSPWYLGLKLNIHQPLECLLNHSLLPTCTPMTSSCFILLFSLLSSAYVYLYLAWLPIKTLNSLWVETLPVLFTTLSSSLEIWLQYKFIEWINNKYLAWWTMECPDVCLKIRSRAVSLPMKRWAETERYEEIVEYVFTSYFPDSDPVKGASPWWLC